MAHRTRAQKRKALSVVRGGEDLPPARASSSHCGSDSGGVEFGEEEIEALLNEKGQSNEHINNLKQCIRWFQKLLESSKRKCNCCVEKDEEMKEVCLKIQKKCNNIALLMEANKNDLKSLRKDLEAVVEKLAKDETDKFEALDELKAKNNELKSLKKNLEALQEKLAKEETNKFEAVDALGREKVFRLAAESSQAFLLEELTRIERDNASGKQKASQDMAINEELTTKTRELESTCLAQSEQIRRLQEQLSSAEKKLQVEKLKDSCLEQREEDKSL